MRLLANASWPRLWLSTYTLYIYMLYDILGPFEALRSWNIGNNNNKLRSRRGRLPLGPFETLWSCNINRRVAALRARTAAIYRTKEVPHTFQFSADRVWSLTTICPSVRQVGQLPARSALRTLKRTAVLACAHGASVHGLLSWGPVS